MRQRIERTAVAAMLTLAVAVAQPTSGASGKGDPEKLLDGARKALVATHYAEAAQAFQEAARLLRGEPRTEALYMAGLAWTQLREPEGLRNGAAVLADLLVEIEPEDRFYSKSMLLQGWNSAALGDSALAKKQLREAEIYLPPDEIPRALWICRELLTAIGDRFGADSCGKKLNKLYPASLEVKFGGKQASPVVTRPTEPSARATVAPQAAAATAPKGVATVTRQSATTAAPQAAATVATVATTAPAVPPEGTWCLQLGAFAERTNAESLAAKYRTLPGDLRIVAHTVDGKNLYLVRIYSFRTREEAETFRKKHFGTDEDVAQIRFIR